MLNTPAGRGSRVPGIAPKRSTRIRKCNDEKREAEQTWPQPSTSKNQKISKVLRNEARTKDQQTSNSARKISQKEAKPKIAMSTNVFSQSQKPELHTLNNVNVDHAPNVPLSYEEYLRNFQAAAGKNIDQEEMEEEHERESINSEIANDFGPNDDQDNASDDGIVASRKRFDNVHDLHRNLDNSIDGSSLNVTEAVLFTMEYEDENFESDAHVQAFIKRNANNIDSFISNDITDEPADRQIAIMQKQQILIGNVLLQKVKSNNVGTEKLEVERLEDSYLWDEMLPPITNYHIVPPFKIPIDEMKAWRPSHNTFLGCVEDYLDHFNRNATSPVQDIQNYSGSKRKPCAKYSLLSYPTEVKRYLRDSTEHTFKFRRAELSMTRDELQNNLFYNRFGNNDDTRWENLNQFKQCLIDFETKGFDALLVSVMSNIRRCKLENGRLVRKS